MKTPAKQSASSVPRPVWLAAAAGAALALIAVLLRRKRTLTRQSQASYPTAAVSAPPVTPPAALEPSPVKPAPPSSIPSAEPPPIARLRNWRRRLAGAAPAGLAVLALLAAYTAQAVFNEDFSGVIHFPGGLLEKTSQPLLVLAGSLLLLAAVALWLLALPHTTANRQPHAWEKPTAQGRLPGISLRSLLLVASASLSLAATLVNACRGESQFVRTAWLTGILAFVVILMPEGSRVPGRTEHSPAFRWQHILILGFILAGGLWLRQISLETIPYDMHGDMASEGILGREFLLGMKENIFLTDWAGLPAISFIPEMLGLRLFGNNLYGLRMSAVVAGMLSLLGLYLLSWRLFDSHRLAALSAGALAVSIPHIHFSRIPGYISNSPLILFGFFFLIDGLRSRKRGPLVLAGALLGLAFEMYFSARIIVPLLGIFLVYLYFFHKPWIMDNLGGLGLACIAALMVNGPFILYYMKDPVSFMTRTRDVWLFSPDVMRHLVGKYGVDGPLGVVWEQVKRTILMFNYYWDTSTQFGFAYPMFHWLLAPLVPLGAALGIRRWREPAYFFISIWVILNMVFGSMLTVDAPFWPRLVILIPAACVLAAFPLEALVSRLEAARIRFAPAVLTTLCAFLITAAGVLGWNLYHSWVQDFIHPEAKIGRFLYSLPPDLPACGFGAPFGISVRETAFLAWPRQLVDLPLDAPVEDLRTCPTSPVVWIFTPESLPRLEEIRQMWPDGQQTAYYAANGDYVFTSYLVGVDYDEVTRPGSNPTAGPLSDFAPTAASILAALGMFAAGAVYAGHHSGPSLRLPKLSFLDARLALPAHPASETVQDLAGGLAGIAASIKLGTLSQAQVRRALALPGLAVILVFSAQLFFDGNREFGIHLPGLPLGLLPEETRFTAGALLTLAGFAVWTWFARPPRQIRVAASSIQPLSRTVVKSFRVIPLLGLITGGAALSAAVVSVAIYAAAGESSGLRWLWLAGMILALASAGLAQAQNRSASQSERSPSFGTIQIAALAVILTVAAWLRLYRLDSMPFELSTDMASYGLFARDFVLGNETAIFGEGWFYIPRLEFLLATATMSLAGNNLYGLYLATVIYGLVNLLAAYLLVWRLSDSHPLALLTLVVLAFNPAHIEFSRISAFMTPWAAGYLGLYFFIDGLRGRKPLSLAASGLLVALSMQVYPAGRVLPFILLSIVAWAWIFRRAWVIDNLAGLGFLALAGLAALGPNLAFFAHSWDVYVARAKEVFLFQPDIQRHLKFTYDTTSPWVVLWEQIRRSFFTFQYYSDISAHFSYPHPMLSSWLAPLLGLGVGTAITRLRRPAHFTLLLIFLAVLVSGGVLTVNAPTWTRLVGLLPAAACLIALPLEAAIRRLPGILGTGTKKALVAITCLVVLMAGLSEWHIYRQEVSEYGRPPVQAARFIADLPSKYTACGITSGFDLDWSEIRFMGWPRTLVSLDPENPDLDNPACAARPTAWVFTADKMEFLAQVRGRFPGGVEIRIPDYQGYVDVIAYRLD